jgi:hypothetical protein
MAMRPRIRWNARLRCVVLAALLASLASAAAAQEADPHRRFLIGLTGEGGIEALQSARRIEVEFGLSEGVERVPARVEAADLAAGVMTLRVELLQPVDAGSESNVRGVLFRDDHAHGGAALGWTIGSIAGWLLLDRLLSDGMSAWPRRLAGIGGAAAGGFAGSRAGGLVGRAFGTPRGFPVQWMRPLE